MIILKAARNSLAGTAAVALIVASAAFPAAAQTTTTPNDNGAGCSGSASNQANCTNSNSPSCNH